MDNIATWIEYLRSLPSCLVTPVGACWPQSGRARPFYFVGILCRYWKLPEWYLLFSRRSWKKKVEPGKETEGGKYGLLDSASAEAHLLCHLIFIWLLTLGMWMVSNWCHSPPKQQLPWVLDVPVSHIRYPLTLIPSESVFLFWLSLSSSPLDSHYIYCSRDHYRQTVK